MQTVSQPMSLTVEMRPFFEEDKPDVYKEFMEDGFIGQGIFFDGQEFVSLSDFYPSLSFGTGKRIFLISMSFKLFMSNYKDD